MQTRGWQHHLSARYSSLDREGGRERRKKVSNPAKHPLNGSPYAFGVSTGQLLLDPIASGQQWSVPTPLPPALNTTIGSSPEEEEVNRSSSEHKKSSTQACNEAENEGGLRFSGGGGGSTVVSDSPRSASSANSFETLASAAGGSNYLDLDYNSTSYFADGAGAGSIDSNYCAAVASAEMDTGQKMKVLGVVDRMLLESWKSLPWQARLCPKAIEEQEVVRRTSEQEIEVTRWPANGLVSEPVAVFAMRSKIVCIN